MNDLTIYISWEWALGIIGTLIVLAWMGNGRFTRIETLLEGLKDKIDILWKDRFAPSSSPRQLNERGSSILENSGIKEIVDQNKDKLLNIVKERKTNNPYDTEMAINEVMSKLPEYCPETLDALKEGAFKTGVDVAAVLYVGAIYLRNLIFPDLGYSLKDLDEPRH